MEPTGYSADYGAGEKCGEWWPLLSAHADGETDADEARALEAHVAGCSDCARELAGLKRFSIVLSGLTPVDPPPGLQRAILAHTFHRVGIAARIRNAFRVPQVQWASMAAAGAAAALLYSFFQPRLPIEPTRLSDRTTSSAPKPVIAHSDKPRPTAPLAARALIEPAPVPSKQPDRQLASVEPASLPPTQPAVIRTRRTASPQPAAPGTAVSYKFARLSTPKPVFAPKPNSTVTPSATDEMAAAMADAERKIADASASEVTNLPATPTATPAVVQTARIQLVSASGGIPPGQIATLAGLKKELQSQRVVWNAQSVKDSLRDKQLRIDVIRSTF